MKIRLGYACISKTLENITTSTNYTYTNFKEEHDYEKLNKVICSNLEALEEIIDYNIANNIHFFRLSSKLIPLATHKDVQFDYITPYQKYYRRIGEKIEKHQLRMDFHLDQFCVLNSVKQNVIDATIEALKYHYAILEALNIKEKVLILHIGGNTFGKEKALTRFVNQFKKLPLEIQKSVVIENDDKIFNIVDCINIHRRLGIPIVLDYHHYRCNNNGEKLEDYIEEIFDSWGERKPKIHFSSPKNNSKKDFRSHHDYINVDEFIRFIEEVKKINRDFDIMIEAKAKDEALFRLIRQLKYKTNYQFIDDTTWIV